MYKRQIQRTDTTNRWGVSVAVIITPTIGLQLNPGRVFSSLITTGLMVSVRCIDYYDMLHNTLSVTEHPCETMDYTGKAYFLITREQLQDWSEYRTRYYDN